MAEVNEFQKSLHLVLVDSQKAFDTLKWDNIWRLMKRKEITNKLMILHNDRVNNHQGCLLSLQLCLTLPDATFQSRNMEMTFCRISILLMTLPWCWPDTDIQRKIDLLNVNVKYQYQQNKKYDHSNWKSNIHPEPQLRWKFWRLNNLQISTFGEEREDMELHIRTPQYAFTQLNNIWCLNHFSLKTKMHLFNSCIKFVLRYGCETWLVSTNITQKLWPNA